MRLKRLMDHTNTLFKFTSGSQARIKWAKPIKDERITVDKFNSVCENVFKRACNIVLDNSERRQTTLKVTDFTDEANWKKDDENIYLIVRNDKIMKIGGTRTGMKSRFGSYLCGHCVSERNKKSGGSFPGKMSVTNAYLYHTIEKDLLENKDANWSFWTWKLPITTFSIKIFGDTVKVAAQTYHAYESTIIKKFKVLAGYIPQLCNNSDPSYR